MESICIHESFANKEIILKLPQKITWYNCGPTIYDKSHLGHARTFIIFDVMRKYFKSKGHEVIFAMNITDIDDKIINKVKKQHWTKIIFNLINAIGMSAFRASWKDINNETDPDFNNLDKLEKWLLTQKISPLREADICPTFDIYTEFIKKMEDDFWKDVVSINVVPPDIKMAVSKVIPNIINVVKKLIDKKYAYENNGSVYFNTDLYIENYKKGLVDVCVTDFSIKDGHNHEKKHARDFTLWKAQKQYEIAFESPWGMGRPGWAIECSTMISEIFGNNLTIHSGGIDLKFPHHHNEFLQTTALTDDTEWVTYFLHSGHLCVDNEKMSKSLGNFITIESFLEKHEPNILRLLFLNYQWNSDCNLTDETIKFAEEMNSRFNNYLNHITHLQKTKHEIKTEISKTDMEYMDKCSEIKDQIENQWFVFSTKMVIQNVNDLIKATYIYLDTDFNMNFVENVTDFIVTQFNLLGLTHVTKNNNSGTDITKLVDTIVNIREEIRKVATAPDKKKLYELSDRIRDEFLPSHGIKLDDLPSGAKWIMNHSSHS